MADYVVGAAVGQGLLGPRLAGIYRPSAHAVSLEEIPQALVTRPGFVERLAAAGRRAAALTAPHVVPVYDLARIDLRLFLVCGPCEGRSLAALLGDESPLPLPGAFAITDAVLAALEEIHGRGLVHGDACPETVIITSSGEVRLSELGLAAVLAADAGLAEWPAVAPPEGSAPSPAADLYAAGMLLRELVTGLRPEQRGEWAGPAPLGRLVARAVSPNPAHRLGDARELRQELRRVAATLLGEDWREQGDLAARATRPAAAQRLRPRRLTGTAEGDADAAGPEAPPPPLMDPPAPAPPPPASAPFPPPMRPLGDFTSRRRPFQPSAPGMPADAHEPTSPERDRPASDLPWVVRRHRRRRRAAAGIAVLVLVLAVAVAVLAVIKPFPAPTPPGPVPLSVGEPTLSVRPAGPGGCGTTFTFAATGSLGGSGSLTYRWLVSETGNPTTYEQYTASIQGETSYDYTKQLGFSGAASIAITVTFEILSPESHSATLTQRYACAS